MWWTRLMSCTYFPLKVTASLRKGYKIYDAVSCFHSYLEHRITIANTLSFKKACACERLEPLTKIDTTLKKTKNRNWLNKKKKLTSTRLFEVETTERVYEFYSKFKGS